MRRPILALLPCALFAACGLGDAPTAPSTEGLSSLREAADVAAQAYGVPADLVLAVSYAETRWQLPTGDSDAGATGEEGEGHAPGPVGLGGFRPWASYDPIGIATDALHVDPSIIATDPYVGIVATTAVLRALAVARFGETLPSPSDVGAWRGVIEDYSGLNDPEGAASYADDVFAYLRRGLRAKALDGTTVTLRSRDIVFPSSVESIRSYGGAEYPGARFSPASTANYTAGRGGVRISMVVIHTMQGSYAGSISWFANPAAGASAHYNVRSSDGEITQSVSEGDRAWHAGNWDVNERSIGIEHEGYVADPGRWYTDAMYRSSAALTRHLCDKYGIPIDRDHIIGHNEVPDPYHAGEFGGAGHHTDPGGGWDWSRYMTLVRGVPEGPAHAASFVAKDHPAEMTSGERAVAWVELRNDGSSTWSIDTTRLGTTAERDHASPFYDAENWINDHRASAADHSTYSTGTTGRFTFMISAPEVTEDTMVGDTFGLVEEGVEWFGPEDIRIEILVHPRAGATVPPVDGCTPSGAEICGDGIDQDCSGADAACGGDIPTGPEPEPTDPTTEHVRAGMGATSGGCSAAGAPAHTAPATSGAATWATLALALALAKRRRRRS